MVFIATISSCTIASKINVTPKGVYLPISKQHSILAVANLLAHNNKSQICYCGQISLQSAAVNCSFSDNLLSEKSINYFSTPNPLHHSKHRSAFPDNHK